MTECNTLRKLHPKMVAFQNLAHPQKTFSDSSTSTGVRGKVFGIQMRTLSAPQTHYGLEVYYLDE